MIQNISIDKLHPHPDNPRKDLGDLSELAESIKAQGILQNLTVVELDKYEKGYYRIVIGHRRFEAAKLAGLTELPCVVSTMDYKTQVATMLLENMQRSDLTVYEQAQGFQMMLDLGESLANISEKTGFSETTVRRRVKLLELDPEKFKASAERNVTLMDYAELEKIEDITLRNKVLDVIGTPNFKYELQKAIDKEKADKNMAKYIEQLSTFATQIDNSSGMRWVTSYYLSRDDEVEIPDDAGEVKYYYLISNYGYITLYKEAVETEEDTAEKEKRDLRQAKYNALDEITKRAFNLRQEFMKGISNTKAKKSMEKIAEYCTKGMVQTYGGIDIEDMANLLGIELSEDEDIALEELIQEILAQPERYMLLFAYCLIEDERERYYHWDCSHGENENLDRVYDFLTSLGYELSDEEQAMRDGTHELFKAEEGEYHD
jgi:ParB family chromosome partitioning protein